MNRAFGGFSTTIYVENTSGQALAAGAVSLAYYDNGGASVGAGDSSPPLADGAVWVISQRNGHSFADGSAGSGVLKASDRVTAFVNQEIPVGDGSAYNGVPGFALGDTVYAPTILNNAYGGFTTGVGAMNAGEVTSTVAVKGWAVRSMGGSSCGSGLDDNFEIATSGRGGKGRGGLRPTRGRRSRRSSMS